MNVEQINFIEINTTPLLGYCGYIRMRKTSDKKWLQISSSPISYAKRIRKMTPESGINSTKP